VIGVKICASAEQVRKDFLCDVLLYALLKLPHKIINNSPSAYTTQYNHKVYSDPAAVPSQKFMWCVLVQSQ
jgi:hypothetical protein